VCARTKDATLADSHVKCTEGVSTGNLTADEEIVLSHLGSARSDTSGPDSHSIDCDLSCLIDTNAIEIESLEGETGELYKPLHDMGLPFFETVLDGGKLGQLTHPIWVDTEGFEISVLIEVGSFASVRRYFCGGILEDRAIFEIERGEYARCVPGIVDLNQTDRQ